MLGDPGREGGIPKDIERGSRKRCRKEWVLKDLKDIKEEITGGTPKEEPAINNTLLIRVRYNNLSYTLSGLDYNLIGSSYNCSGLRYNWPGWAFYFNVFL